jgi:aminoglycoside phosphotransferase family enzyme/predicted kinase
MMHTAKAGVAVEDQGEVIGFLSRAESYAHGAGGGPVERIETHISIVFLVGARAYKLKRAVRYPYLDFSTRDLRRAFAEAEVAVNRRTAPGLYLGAVPVTRAADGRLALGGEGEPVEWLVEMARFDQACLFDRLAQAGALDVRRMEELAETVARFHERAEPRPAADAVAGLGRTIAGNAASFAPFAGALFEAAEVARLIRSQEAALERQGELLEARRRTGRVRHCHGDLHLRNVCLFDGRPVLFDAIEFNPAFADIDVLYDLAFLLMDLDHRGLRGLAGVVFNRYMDLAADAGGLPLLPLFLSLRAAIRAHVSAAAAGTDVRGAAGLRDEARAYLKLALDYLAPPPPRLVAIGGLSGTGKSSLARGLAPEIGAAPGARVVRSDVVRKRLAGVSPTTRLGAEGYTAEMTERTYGACYAEIEAVLRAGHGAIADAVFARPEQRLAVARVAGDLGVPFQGIWLDAPARVLAERVEGRRGDASDATPEIVLSQLAHDPGPVAWTAVDAAGGPEEMLARAQRALGLA